MPAKVILEVLSGPLRGQAFTFDLHDTFLFGRGGDCHARLPNDGLVSRHHFLLEANPPDVCVRDLGSLNGTLVNDVKHGGRDPSEEPEDAAGRHYEAVDLSDGDRLTVGNTSIQVRVQVYQSCSACQSEISEPDLPASEWGAGWMCGSCRSAAVTEHRSKAVSPAPRCQGCGKDVSGEMAAGRRGDFVCAACRATASSAAGGLARLIQQAAVGPAHQSGLALENYALGDELGRGGMGVVYAARRKSDGLRVAVKIMLAKVAVEEHARNMFEREISLTATLRHPHIVELLESGVAGSVFYAVMEFCPHGNLHGLVRRQGGKIPLATAILLMRHCLAGLAHAHNPPSAGQPRLVHRDLKPHNILLAEHQGMWIAKIADFGLAKSFEMAGLSGMTATGAIGGTCHFMPREQLTNFKYVQPASDVWSIAATFYYMLTGHVPLDFPAHRDAVEVILRDEPIAIRRRVSSIPAALADVIDRALSTDLAVRYESAGEMYAALERATQT